MARVAATGADAEASELAEAEAWPDGSVSDGRRFDASFEWDCCLEGPRPWRLALERRARGSAVAPRKRVNDYGVRA
eukprot:132192-Alexandrium_andersonii.AAC.1